jgi:hypothetical protein
MDGVDVRGFVELSIDRLYAPVHVQFHIVAKASGNGTGEEYYFACFIDEFDAE